MNYPIEILPNPQYKMIDCDLSNYYLLRTTETNKHEELWDDEMNMLREDCICNPKERISDLSTSLFGIYNTEHIVIELTDKGKKTTATIVLQMKK